MNRFVRVIVKLAGAGLICVLAWTAPATNLDTLGVTLLRQVDPTLNGSGVRVAQVEAPYFTAPLPPYAFEVVPSVVGQPVSLFTYYSDLGTSTSYPNSVGVNSDHAASVAGNFYGNGGFGVATNVAHVDNYEANFFFNMKIKPPGTAIPAAVVNQSFLFDATEQALVDPNYDDYVVSHKTIFVNGAGNGGSISTNPPATCFNGISVGVTDGNSSYGPTSDGRSKPDITSPGSGATSFSTPYVSGAAALLVQAAARNDGGASTASMATYPVTIKALLLNGAVKPADWTNGPVTPLDARYGAGVLNVFNSWKQLKGGRVVSNETTTVGSGAAHPPGASTNNEPVLTGWDYTTLSTSVAGQDKINHYYFNLTGSNAFTLTATLVWNRQSGQATVNNLDLFLYNTSNSNLVLSSTSVVDNVEHLFLPQLPPGRYDLQVLKPRTGQVATSEPYALAFEFFCVKLKIALTNGLATLSWTNAPTGFRLTSSPTLDSPALWTTVAAVVTMTNGQNTVSIPVTGANQFFRLQRP